jgi:cytochrome c oxidase subunit 2
MSSGCALCHAVRGTPARGTTAPDLTHLASRLTIAAGTLPNTKGHLAGWIANPQGIKPGSLMPRIPLEPEELRVLLAYLGTLR